MLHHLNSPQEVKKAYPFAAAAKMEGIDFYYFSFQAVDFERKKINGWVYEDREWKQKLMDFPSVIINSCNPKNKKQSEILKRLGEMAVLTSHPVGNKLNVYKKLLNGGAFSDYLIPSTLLTSAEALLELLQERKKAVIKPVKGNHGKKVFFVERNENSYIVTEDTNAFSVDQVQLYSFVDQLVNEQKFLLQPYIYCKTKSGSSYDFRLHVQKNGIGTWDITLIYPRISAGKKLISNISNGGYRGELAPFLKEEFGADAVKVKSALEDFAYNFPKHFETLYIHSFDELGLDVGVDENQKLWLFEVNWRPGSKNREFDVAKRLIPYCVYLAGQNRLST
jgi:glutathione synthase/RimK-type ligase-like ATP-grasp enzyme